MTVIWGWKDEAAGWARAPDKQELPPGQVIAWLRSAEGEEWSDNRIGELERHLDDSGMFADVRADGDGFMVRSRWPEPYSAHDLDDPGNFDDSGA